MAAGVPRQQKLRITLFGISVDVLPPSTQGPNGIGQTYDAELPASRFKPVHPFRDHHEDTCGMSYSREL
jgi:hypothetical protein